MQIKALIVDNNPVLQKAISALVEKEGCQVRTADDGLQALEAMKRFTPDILFTDLVMPLVDGEQLCKIIRNTAEYKSIFIVVISAILFEERQRIMQEVECDLCIAKGNLKELRTHIREALDHYRKRTKKTSKFLGTTEGTGNNHGVTAEILDEKRHRQEVVACLSEGVIELNHQGKIVEINQAALDILEKKEEQVIGLSVGAIDWGNHSVTVSHWLDSQLIGKGMQPLHLVDEEPVFIADKVLTLSLLAVAQSKNFGLCIVRDITRQYRAEEYKKNLDASIRLLKKMEAMSGMAGGMAHDFNNLLTVICGNIDILQLTYQSADENDFKTVLNQAKESAQAAVELVRKISHFSAFGIISRESADIGDVIKQAVSSFATTAPINVTFDFDKSSYNVSIDKEQIVTSIHNILQNSIDAQGHTNIAIELRNLALDKPLVDSRQYVPAGNYVKIAIIDKGKGIDQRSLVQIFDPYFTTKKRSNIKGIGLGLTVVYATIRNHGGYVVVDSDLGKGTTFSIFLPFYEKNYPKNAADWVSKGFTDRHILIVDEDDQSRQVGVVMLEYLGFSVISGSQSKTTLQMFENNVQAGNRFAGALVNLPVDDSLLGVKMCRELHGFDAGLKVVATSSSLVDPVMADCHAFGFVNTLPKPYTIDDLKNILSSLQMQ